MNSELLLKHFDTLTNTPEAVSTLRGFILDIAIRGKLAKQLLSDEPASELLQRIRAEKARVSGTRQRKDDKLASQPSEVDHPFWIPRTWCWSQLAEIGFINPRNNAPDDTNVSFVPMPLISADYGVAHQCEVRRWGDIKTGYTHFADGDVGLAKITPCFENGKSTVFSGLLGGIGAGTTELHVVRPIFVSAGYILIFLKSPHFINTGIPIMTGTAGQKRVPAPYFNYSPFPLPPLAEQRRIVDKVDELMALCDRLESAQRERQRQADKLAAIASRRLSEAACRESRREEGRFYLLHLPRVTRSRAHVSLLRRAIFNLAFRGYLVPQEPKDEPVVELLKRIQKGPSLAPTTVPAIADTWPYQLPESWTWVHFGQLVRNADAGWSPKCEAFPRSGDKWGVLKVSAVSWDRFLGEENKQLLDGTVPPERARVGRGDFLISRANTSELVAKCVLVEDEPTNLILSDKIVRLQIADECNKKFLCMVNNHAAHARSYYAEKASGTSHSMKNVSRDVIYALPIPLPPVPEQDRIVAKVEELVSVCDRLEERLTETQLQGRRLLEALLSEALVSQSGTDRLEAICR